MYFKNNINKKICVKKNNMDKSINNSNRVRQILKIEKPVIQGPLFWLTDAKLVAAVSEAGGLGVLGPHAGENSLPEDDEEKAERMRTEIRKVKEFYLQVKIQMFNLILC